MNKPDPRNERLEWNQERLSRSAFVHRLWERKARLPTKEEWDTKAEIVTHLGVYNVKDGVLTHWLVSAGDEHGGR